MSMFWWIMTQLKFKRTYVFEITDSTSKMSSRIVDCVIIYRKIDIGIEYF